MVKFLLPERKKDWGKGKLSGWVVPLRHSPGMTIRF